ncbi:MAG: hypothetical protein ACJ72U_16125 [Nitrososphaeraceae archaeon]
MKTKYLTDLEYFSLLFIAIENSFRSLYKALFPAEDVSKIGFKRLYENLLSEIGFADYCELLKLLTYIRNAVMHTNSVHTHEDDTVTWKGLTVHFRKGESVQLGEAWKAMFYVTPGILEMLKQVVNSLQVMEKPIVNDPSYD